MSDMDGKIHTMTDAVASPTNLQEKTLKHLAKLEKSVSKSENNLWSSEDILWNASKGYQLAYNLNSDTFGGMKGDCCTLCIGEGGAGGGEGGGVQFH